MMLTKNLLFKKRMELIFRSNLLFSIWITVQTGYHLLLVNNTFRETDHQTFRPIFVVHPIDIF